MRNFVAVMCAKRFLILFFAALVAMAASAQELVVDTLPRRVAWATARVRMRAPRMADADWSATLGDTSKYMRVRVRMSAPSEIYGRRAVATAFCGGRGGEAELGKAEFDCAGDEASVRIVYDGYSARVYAGEVANVLVCRLDSLCPGPFVVEGAEPVEAWARFLPIPEPEAPAFSTADSLLVYLQASDDPREGLWRYLDRDMDANRATLGAYYDLATVRRPDGGYDIISLDVSGPLQIKGRLAPTIFIGHFDLAWRDASGLPVADEASAQFAPDGSILTLRFPLHRAQIRFSRAR